MDLRRLEDDVPEVAEARPRAISTVLAKEGGDGRGVGGGALSEVWSETLSRGTVKGAVKRRSQGRLTAAMTALARPGTAESGRECW